MIATITERTRTDPGEAGRTPGGLNASPAGTERPSGRSEEMQWQQVFRPAEE
jgi:hypothetical protein